MCPEQGDAWCVVENRRTPFDYRCDDYTERTHRDFGPPPKEKTTP